MTDKKVNVWLLVGISFIPILGMYSRLKLKKFWAISIVNVCASMIGGLIAILWFSIMDQNDPMTEQTTTLLFLVIMGFIFVPEALLIYHWAKEHNNKLEHLQQA